MVNGQLFPSVYGPAVKPFNSINLWCGFSAYRSVKHRDLFNIDTGIVLFNEVPNLAQNITHRNDDPTYSTNLLSKDL